MLISDFHKDVLSAKICPYCRSKTKILSEIDIYGKLYKGRKIIACSNYPSCDSYVGTHEDGKALGRLANLNLRKAKVSAHFWFDKMWKKKLISRSVLYRDLSIYLNLPSDYTHIGMFNESLCKKVMDWSKLKYEYLKSK